MVVHGFEKPTPQDLVMVDNLTAVAGLHVKVRLVGGVQPDLPARRKRNKREHAVVHRRERGQPGVLVSAIRYGVLVVPCVRVVETKLL